MVGEVAVNKVYNLLHATKAYFKYGDLLKAPRTNTLEKYRGNFLNLKLESSSILPRMSLNPSHPPKQGLFSLSFLVVWCPTYAVAVRFFLTSSPWCTKDSSNCAYSQYYY